MNLDRPYFRNDLVARPLDDGGQRLIEVTDPDSGTSFKFYEIEYAIACAMDGERDVGELAEWARIELGLEPSPDELQVVIGTLGDLGYLEGISGQARAAEGRTPPATAAGGVTRGWDVQSPEEAIPQSAKPTPRTPLARPPAAAGAVTRGWDAQSGDDVDLGLPGKAPAAASAAGASAAGGVTRGWDVPAGDDLELGFAGRAEQGARRGNEPRAAAGEFELGAAGNRGMTDPEAVTYSGAPPVESVHDRDTVQRGAVGGSDFDDVSTDLSDHVPLAASELKEAVRSSKVMGAVKPPHEQDTQVDGPKVGVGAKTVMGWQAPAVPASPAAKPHVTVQKQPQPGQQPGRAAPAAPPAGQPMVLPDKRAEISRPHAAATPIAVGEPYPGQGQPQEKKSVLIPVLLVLALLAAAGGVAYWYFVVRPKSEGTATGTAPSGQTDTATPGEGEGTAPAEGGTSAPAAAPIAAMLEAGPNPEHILTAPKSGRFSWLAPAGSEVAVGAPVAKFEGIQGWERLLTASQESQKKYQERLDQATSKGDKNAMKAAEDNVKRKQADIDRATAEMAKYVIAAPLGGVVEPSVQPKVWIKKDTPVAKILAQAGPRATFTLPTGRSHAAGDQVQVSSKADPALKATCKVDSAEGDSAGQKIVVTCPTDSGLAAGSEVVLK